MPAQPQATTRQKTCQVCEEKGRSTPSKYRCPACGVRTCSKTCVHAHKHNAGCNGVRNRAAPVRKCDYGEEELMSDYTLLEETNRAVDAASRKLAKDLGGVPGLPQVEGTRRGIFGKRRRTLIETVRKRKMRIGFMPAAMERHRQNTTTVKRLKKQDGSGYEQTLFWCMELCFTRPDELTQYTSVIAESCPEDQLVSVLIDGALSMLKKRLQFKSHTSEDESVLYCYSTVGTSDLNVFLCMEKFIGLMRPDADDPIDKRKYQPEYRQLNMNSSIKDALRGVYVIEFPRVLVVRKRTTAAEIAIGKSE